MPTHLKFGCFIAIIAVIAMFFAAPIVAPVSPALAAVLVAIGTFYSLGVAGQIWLSYRTVETKDE